MKNIGFLIGLFLSLTASAFARTNLDVSDQSTQSLGAAGAYTAIAEGHSAFSLNPAGLSRNAGYRKFYFDSRFYEDFNQWGLKTALIDGVTEDPLHWGFLFDTTRTSLLKKQQYAFSSSFDWRDFILVGTTTRFTQFNRTATITPLWMFGMDAGILAFVSDNISLGLCVRNFIRSKTDAALAPVKFSGGLGWNLQKLRLDLDVERNQSADKTTGRFGLEYMITPSVTLRSGYFQDRERNEWGYSVGASIQPDPRFHLDIGFLDQLESVYKVFSAGVSITI